MNPEQQAADVLATLGARVTLPTRDAHYDTARLRIANAAILPSRAWQDSSIWTARRGPVRTLGVRGQFSGGRYRLVTDSAAPHPSRPAESQHLIHLTRLSDDAEYAWDTDVLYALGDALRAQDVGLLFRMMLSGAEGRAEQEIRADYRAQVPQGSAILGQLFRVDSIRTARQSDGSTLATYAITMSTAGIKDRYPNFARYLRRYVETARMRWTLSDSSGAQFLTVGMRDGRITLRVRTHDRELLPLAGSRRAMPDTLVLTGQFTIEVGMFTVGFRDYRAQFALTREPRETGFTIISREEPHWVLPLVTERLLRGPLKRPFEGRGASFAMWVRDSADAQTILGRTLHLEVKESAILRFLSRLSSTAYGDFQGKVEREQHAWLKEVFDALASDIRS